MTVRFMSSLRLTNFMLSVVKLKRNMKIMSSDTGCKFISADIARSENMLL